MKYFKEESNIKKEGYASKIKLFLDDRINMIIFIIYMIIFIPYTIILNIDGKINVKSKKKKVKN